MNYLYLALSFLAGMLGTIMGGTQTFVVTGLIGILVACLSFFNISIPFLNDVILNIIFMPCIIFNGAAIATAYASKHHEIRGTDTNKSLLFTKDIKVFLLGGLFGCVGYSLFFLFSYYQLPLDIGALVVIIVGVITRALFGTKWFVERPFSPSNENTMKILLVQTLFAAIISLLTIGVVDMTQIVSIGFSLSAASLYLTFIYPTFPATHHITMVVGYAFMQTHNIILSVIFGILAHIICILFGNKFNTVECGSHIDPPAIAIASLSLITFTLF